MLYYYCGTFSDWHKNNVDNCAVEDVFSFCFINKVFTQCISGGSLLILKAETWSSECNALSKALFRGDGKSEVKA